MAAQIARAGKRILTYHVCDWLVPTKDLLLDRGMPGDGVIDLRSIRAMVEATGYNGLIDVEIFSAQNWWKREPSECCGFAWSGTRRWCEHWRDVQSSPHAVQREAPLATWRASPPPARCATAPRRTPRSRNRRCR